VTTERRRFLATASGAMAAAAAAAIVDAPNVIAQPKVQWRMSTAWTPALDHLQGAAQRLAKVVEETSGGRFRIEVYPGGQIMPPFECFAAASKGTIEAFMASAYYWTAREPAVEWFTAVPFGMDAEGMAAWYYQGEGLKLWEETYAAFNLVPRPATAVSPQMAGWFRKKTNTIGDYKGLKMRIGTGRWRFFSGCPPTSARRRRPLVPSASASSTRRGRQATRRLKGSRPGSRSWAS
jgi:TRAP-type mannitol/chloroaromatic compound transport system substrate-binding protein